MVWLWLLNCALPPAAADALSLGPISIKSGFGERFMGEIELQADDSSEVTVSLGTRKDYEQLRIARQNTVDELRIDSVIPAEGNKRLISITSGRPLFFPSLNLIVKAVQNGGLVMENYLIAVDFQQSLRLGEIPDSKRGAGGQPEQKEKPQEQSNDAAAAKPETVKPPEAGEPAKEALAIAKVEPKSPAPMISTGMETGFRAPAAISAQPFSEFGPRETIFVEDAFAAAKARQERAVKMAELPAGAEKLAKAAAASPGKLYGPVQSGESLIKISQKLKLSVSHPARIAAAVWQDNPEQFILGNIHCLRIGAILNLEKLERRLAGISSENANRIIANHALELKIIKTAAPVKTPPPAAYEEPAPSELSADTTAIFVLLKDWKESWEQGDLIRHLALYSPRFKVRNKDGDWDLSRWQNQKLTLFRENPAAQIELRSAQLSRLDNRFNAVFEQKFKGARLSSLGLKKLELLQENGVWKIASEVFAPYAEGERRSAESLVVLAATYPAVEAAVQAVNIWRQRGFNAYYAPFLFPTKKAVYRVFVDHFTDASLAESAAASLRKWTEGKYAVVMPAPFSFLLNTFDAEGKAAERMKSLRAQHISSLLLPAQAEDFSVPAFKIMAGAFTREDDALALKQQLLKAGIPAILGKN